MSRSRLIAGGMLRRNTPIEDHRVTYGLMVKREDLSCPPPGPPFSKTRGVYAHLKKRPENLIGVLDTYHSQGGHAVARACEILGKECCVFYPEYKYEPGHRPPQERAKELGAYLHGLKAGMSAVLFHQARKIIEDKGGYMMPNALKLDESVKETAKEVPRDRRYNRVIISASSGTLAAGVIRGFLASPLPHRPPSFIIHLGYSRPHQAVVEYISKKAGFNVSPYIRIVDEGYSYKDQAKGNPQLVPPWPCNPYYDLKAFRWWVKFYCGMTRKEQLQRTLFWNIG